MITKLIFQPLRDDGYDVAQHTELAFFKPFPAKLFRLYVIPAYLKNNREFLEVINTLKFREHKGVYYFRLEKQQDEAEFCEIFSRMGIQPFLLALVEPNHPGPLHNN